VTRPVLIINDDLDLLYLYGQILNRFVRLENILIANGGQEGIDLLAEYIPSVIITSLGMAVSGNDVIHYILSQPRLDDVKIIVLSARPDGLSDEGKERASAILCVPASPREIEAMVIRFAAEFES